MNEFLKTFFESENEYIMIMKGVTCLAAGAICVVAGLFGLIGAIFGGSLLLPILLALIGCVLFAAGIAIGCKMNWWDI